MLDNSQNIVNPNDDTVKYCAYFQGTCEEIDPHKADIKCLKLHSHYEIEPDEKLLFFSPRWVTFQGESSLRT